MKSSSYIRFLPRHDEFVDGSIEYSRLICHFVLLTAVLWAGKVMADQVYVWKGENGVLQFGDSSAVNHETTVSKDVDSTTSNVSYVARMHDSPPDQVAAAQLEPPQTDPRHATADNPADVKLKPGAKSLITAQQLVIDQNTTTNPAIKSLLNVAATHIEANQLNRAAAVIERALRLEAYNAALWLHLSHIYYQLGRYQQAEALLQKAHQVAGFDEKELRLSQRLSAASY